MDMAFFRITATQYLTALALVQDYRRHVCLLLPPPTPMLYIYIYIYHIYIYIYYIYKYIPVRL